MTEKKSPHRLFPHGEFPETRAVALSESGLRQLEALGRPSFMVVPNAYDGMDAPWYFERYPQAAFLTPEEERSGVAEYFTHISDAAIPDVKIVTVSHGDAITDGDLSARLKAAAA